MIPAMWLSPGEGPAGCAAALAAARHGKSVLLLEGSSSLGGMSTQGLVPAWRPFSDKEKIIYKGIEDFQCRLFIGGEIQ
jgi:NADPH-dependent 2,4-dienoyl-CoA reductase/sulfur reductase-like enzyme